MSSASEPVWIVDDDQPIRWVLEQALKREGIESRSFCDAREALKAFDAGKPAVVVTDIRMPGLNGLQFLDFIQKREPCLPVVVMTAFSDLDTTVDSFQRGAREHLPKPFDIDEAVTLVRRLLEGADAKKADEADATPALGKTIVGSTPEIQEVFRAVGRLSKSDLNVLITGESGTGKELIARALFANSIRSKRPFVAINAAAIPADLLESELFGHEKGAFTGANQRRIGRFEQADGGTLFLDEIGDMPHDLQSRFLRVLSEGRFYRVGGIAQITVDVRIIAATNQNLEELIEAKLFRSDLYHRLNVVGIRVPPIRDRAQDIPLLIKHFLRRAADQLDIEEKHVTDEAMQIFMSYRWPGNVREIENVCRMMTVMTPSRTITAGDVPLAVDIVDAQGECDPDAFGPYDWEALLRRSVAQTLIDNPELTADMKLRFDRSMIETVLKHTGGSRIKAAELLGLSRNTLTRKIKDLGIA